jgi:hypothetical protein
MFKSDLGIEIFVSLYRSDPLTAHITIFVTGYLYLIHIPSGYVHNYVGTYL